MEILNTIKKNSKLVSMISLGLGALAIISCFISPLRVFSMILGTIALILGLVLLLTDMKNREILIKSGISAALAIAVFCIGTNLNISEAKNPENILKNIEKTWEKEKKKANEENEKLTKELAAMAAAEKAEEERKAHEKELAEKEEKIRMEKIIKDDFQAEIGEFDDSEYWGAHDANMHIKLTNKTNTKKRFTFTIKLQDDDGKELGYDSIVAEKEIEAGETTEIVKKYNFLSNNEFLELKKAKLKIIKITEEEV